MCNRNLSLQSQASPRRINSEPTYVWLIKDLDIEVVWQVDPADGRVSYAEVNGVAGAASVERVQAILDQRDPPAEIIIEGDESWLRAESREAACERGYEAWLDRVAEGL